MKRGFSLILVLLALVLSACGAGAPNNTTTTNPQGIEPTSQTGSAPLPTTDTTGSTAATVAPVATSMPGSTAMPTTMADSPKGDITYVLSNDPRFSTLAKAVDMAKLGDTLSKTGPFTVFAPTNEAFAALPAGQLNNLLADPTMLGQILSYHVVSGNIRAADIATMTSLQTISGQTIQITKSGNAIMLNGKARLVTTDITTTNGVIHVIDSVLTPASQN